MPDSVPDPTRTTAAPKAFRTAPCKSPYHYTARPCDCSGDAVREEGESDRAYLGIDGTMGDAQDVAHPFIGSVYGEHCRVCGLARAYRKHTEASDAT